MTGKWELKIDIHAGSFEGIKRIAQEALGHVSKAKSVRELPTMWGGGGGGGGDPVGVGCSITVKSPAEERIAQLRKEADDLEAELLSGQ